MRRTSIAGRRLGGWGAKPKEIILIERQPAKLAYPSEARVSFKGAFCLKVHRVGVRIAVNGWFP